MKYLKRWWKSFLFCSVPVSIIAIIFSVCALDSESIVPTMICGINIAWLTLLIIANDPYRGKGKDYEIRDIKDDFVEF